MELKLKKWFSSVLSARLLIVLNGIETSSSPTLQWWHRNLLIVLNGIETKFVDRECFPLTAFNRTKWNWNRIAGHPRIAVHPLLIVLNGIETIKCVKSFKYANAFNRTKWNWNWLRPRCFPCRELLLIVLNGIETTMCPACLSRCRTF